MRFLLSALLLLSSVQFYAQKDSIPQTLTIRGAVSDSLTQNPLEGSVVSLLTLEDSSLVRTTISEPDGNYVLEGIAPGNYFIYISAEGYTGSFSDSFTLIDENSVFEMPLITLSREGPAVLNEVVVTAKIPVVVRKLDRTVVNVDAMISAAGNNVLELLGKSPGVLVDPSGQVMLKGKAGVLIYLDDKPTYLSGDALTSFLRSMPASSVSLIEIITTPPAKYDAAGNVGIINIVTKKSKLKGFNGSISVSYGQGKYAKSNNSFNFNYRNNKVNVFGSLSGGLYDGFNDLNIKRTYKNDDGSVQSYFDQNSQIKYTTDYGDARVGVDYFKSDKTTFGITASGSLNSSFVKTYSISALRDAAENSTGTVYADNTRKNDFGSASLNLNFRHTFDSTGRNLTMDVDYIRYAMKGEAGFLNSIYSAGGTLVAQDRLDGHLPADIQIWTAKTDYTHPLKKDANFSAGAKVSYSYIDNLVDYYKTENDSTFQDFTTSNHFIYDEMITAAYLNYNKTFKRLSFQAGLRSEGTLSRGNQLGNPINAPARFKRDYLNIFPTAYISYSLDSAASHQLNLSYGRRIDRPFYQDLNPFLAPLDKFTYYTGNPLLKPMFSHSLSFTYGYQSFFSATFSYTTTNNEINETIEITEDQLYYSRPGNIGRTQNINLGLNGTIPIAKWLNTSIYSEIANLRYESQLYTEKLNTNGTYFYVYINNSFLFGKGWSAELSGFYISKALSAQVTLLQRGQVGIAVQKKILKEKGNVKLSAQDIFYTQLNNGIINNLRQTYADYTNRSDTRAVFLTFSYSFGKPFQSGPKHEGGAESERNRVKN